MNDALFETAPDFDQPIAVLKHCHDRIRKQIRTMQNLVRHTPKNGQDMEMQQAAHAVLRYFNQAAPNHHADEEDDLLPMLQGTATGEDALLLDALLPDIMREHQQMDTAWAGLNKQLQKIASGASNQLAESDVTQFAEMYTAHMAKEETHIAPMAKKLFSVEQMHTLGDAMRTRRGIAVSSEQ